MSKEPAAGSLIALALSTLRSSVCVEPDRPVAKLKSSRASAYLTMLPFTLILLLLRSNKFFLEKEIPITSKLCNNLITEIIRDAHNRQTIKRIN